MEVNIYGVSRVFKYQNQSVSPITILPIQDDYSSPEHFCVNDAVG